MGACVPVCVWLDAKGNGESSFKQYDLFCAEGAVLFSFPFLAFRAFLVGAWTFSEEGFIRNNLEWFNFGKIRASWYSINIIIYFF